MKNKKSVIENVKFSFVPEFQILESSNESKWLKIGGVALVEGISKNKKIYSFNNLIENDNKKFKFLFGHPDEPEEHLVGKGMLSLQSNELRHEGIIRNTSRHPDVVEMVKDGLLGPSIHASADKIIREKEGYAVEGLSIDGIGLVAFQGVEKASIDYAIAESFEKKDVKESEDTDEQNNNDNGEVNNMPEEENNQKPEEQEEQEEDQEEQEEEEVEESVPLSEFNKLVEKVTRIEKEDIVGKILSLNKEAKKEDLMKESKEVLEVRFEYETKLAKESKEEAVVEESNGKKDESGFEIVENKNGEATISEAAYKKFNEEMRERVK